MEEASIEMDDEYPDCVALYHIGFSREAFRCTRAALLRELRRLADALEASDSN